MRRFVFDNLIYRINDNKNMLFNLTSYRRKVIDNTKLSTLINIEDKINANVLLDEYESDLLSELKKCKQILGNEVEDKVFETLKKESVIELKEYAVRAITFNLTHKCNFSCDYCYQNEYKFHSKYQGTMTIEDIKKIVSYLNLPIFNPVELEEIVISGGEPLLEKNIDTINYICDNIKTNKRTMFTNGINIIKYKNNIDFTKFDEFQISLDGTDEIMESINHCRGFEKVINGIDYLLNLGKKISLISMWSKQLESNLEEFISLLKDRNFFANPNFHIRFASVKNYYNFGKTDTRFYDLEYILQCQKKYGSLMKEINSSIEITSELGVLHGLLHRPLDSQKKIRYKCCDIKRSLPMIFEPNGEVYWCLCLGNENGVIGNYKSQSIFTDKITEFGNRNVFSIDKCKKCKLKYICGGGCTLGITGQDLPLFTPSCGIFNNSFFWDHLEEFV